MADKYIKDKFGTPIGFTRDIGNEVQAFHIMKGLVGRYVKSSDITFTIKDRKQIVCVAFFRNFL